MLNKLLLILIDTILIKYGKYQITYCIALSISNSAVVSQYRLRRNGAHPFILVTSLREGNQTIRSVLGVKHRVWKNARPTTSSPL